MAPKEPQLLHACEQVFNNLLILVYVLIKRNMSKGKLVTQLSLFGVSKKSIVT